MQSGSVQGLSLDQPDRNTSAGHGQKQSLATDRIGRFGLANQVHELPQIHKHVNQTIIKSSFITLCHSLRQTAWRQSAEPEDQALTCPHLALAWPNSPCQLLLAGVCKAMKYRVTYNLGISKFLRNFMKTSHATDNHPEAL